MNPYDRLDLLETFAKLGESSSLREVARLLGVSQSSISRRLSELENLLGCRLATRSPGSSRLTLTKEGLALLRESRDMAERWASLPSRLQGRDSPPEGTLHLIAPAGYSIPLVIDAAADLMARHPHVKVCVSEADQVPDLDAAGADCWVLAGSLPSSGVIWETVGLMTSRLVATPSVATRLNVTSLDQLPEVPFVALQPHVVQTIPLVHVSGRRREVRINAQVQTSSLVSSYRAILHGMGIGPAAQWMSAADVEAGRLVPLLPGWSLEPMAIRVGVPAGRQQPGRVTAFIESLRARLPDQPGFAAPASS